MTALSVHTQLTAWQASEQVDTGRTSRHHNSSRHAAAIPGVAALVRLTGDNSRSRLLASDPELSHVDSRPCNSGLSKYARIEQQVGCCGGHAGHTLQHLVCAAVFESLEDVERVAIFRWIRVSGDRVA